MGLRSSRYASRGTNGPAAPSSSASDQQQTPQQASAVTERVVIDSEEALRSAVLAPKVGHCFEGRMFDTVVDTFGLCSCEDPVQALRQMLKVCSLACAVAAAVGHGSALHVLGTTGCRGSGCA